MIDNKFFAFLRSFNDYVAQFPDDNTYKTQFDDIASGVMEILAANKFATMSRDIFDELAHRTLVSENVYSDTNSCSIKDKTEFVLSLPSVNVHSSEATLYKLECEDMDHVYNVVHKAQDTRFKGAFPFFNVEFIYSQDQLLDEFKRHKIITANDISA